MDQMKPLTCSSLNSKPYLTGRKHVTHCPRTRSVSAFGRIVTCDYSQLQSLRRFFVKNWSNTCEQNMFFCFFLSFFGGRGGGGGVCSTIVFSSLAGCDVGVICNKD